MEEKQSLHDSRVRELAASHRDALARVAGLEKTLSEREALVSEPFLPHSLPPPLPLSSLSLSGELTASRDKARRVVRRLKDDRTHYRQLSEEKQ